MSKIKLIVNFIKYVIYFPLVLPSLLTFAFGLCDKANLIEDLRVNYQRRYFKSLKSNLSALYKLLVDCQNFRNIFYYRSKPYCFLFRFLLKPNPTLHLFVDSLGGGIYIQHGTSTIINAKSVGKNFFVNQNVTVGWRTDSGNPVIGDNVRIGTCATVLGSIKIGDNVKIAAGAHVIKDVPKDSVVIPAPSILYKQEGLRVNRSL